MPTLTDAQAESLSDAVVLLLGVGDDPAVRDQAKSAVYLMVNFVRAYTRGAGQLEDHVHSRQRRSRLRRLRRARLSRPGRAGAGRMKSALGYRLSRGPWPL